MNVKIQIDTRTFVRFWLVVIGFALAAYLIFSARTALTIIGISFFLSIALSRPINWLAKVLPSKSRVLCTAVAYVIVMVILGLVVFLVIPPIVEQTVKFIQNIPNIINAASHQSDGLNHFIARYGLQPEVDRVIANLRDSAAGFASGVGSIVVSSISSVLSVVAALILIFVLTFLMLVEGPAWINRLWKVYHDKRRLAHHQRLLDQMYVTVTSYVTGQLTVSSIAAIVAGIIVFVLSVFTGSPSNLAIPAAAIIFIASLIPVFGEMVGALSVTLILALNNITAAVIFLIIFVIYTQVEANYLSPTIQSKRVALTPLAVLIAVTVGIYMFGIAGGIISIPVAGCIKVLVEDYLNRDVEKEPTTDAKVKLVG